MMDSPPPSPVPSAVRLYLLCSWLLGWGLVLDGMYQRLLGQYLRLGPWLSAWVPLAERLGLQAENTGWLAVVVGAGCLSASFGVIYRRQWGHMLGLVAAAAGLLFAGYGTGLSVMTLLLLLLPAVRGYAVPPRARTPDAQA